MSKFGIKNLWDIRSSGNSNLLTTNNTFTGKNTFENTGSVVSIKTTDEQSFGIEFKDSSNDTIGFVGTNTNDSEQKVIVSGTLGLQLHTPNKDINVNPGSAQLLYNTTSTLKNRREVLVRNDLWYSQKASHNAFTVNANSEQTAQHTFSNLTQGLHELYVILTLSGVDIGFDLKVYVNSPTYCNNSEVKVISTKNWTNTAIDVNALLYFGVVLHGGDKIRWRLHNLGGSAINFSSLKIYQRIPGGIVR